MGTVQVASQIDALIEREGGFVDHPADKGGPTRYGITERVARAHGYKGAMRDLPRVTAASIYFAQYWQLPRLDQVANRYPRLAEYLFDISVNMGQAVAVGFLQRSLNVLNGGGQLYSDIKADGTNGPVTLLALDGFRKRRGAAGEDVLLMAVQSLRGARFIEISEGRPANEAFTYGWFGRMVEMAKDWLK